jgi:hypothetical protein
MFATRSPHVLGVPARPYPNGRRTHDRHRPGAGITALRLAAAARWRSITLDRQLAEGIAPESDPLLAARAAQLTSRRSRHRVAAGLSGAFRTARDRRPRFTAALPAQASELLDAHAVVAALTRRLEDPGPVGVRGVAMLLMLLTDVASPLYQNGEPGLLGSRLRAAAAALESTNRSPTDARTTSEPVWH